MLIDMYAELPTAAPEPYQNRKVSLMTLRQG